MNDSRFYSTNYTTLKLGGCSDARRVVSILGGPREAPGNQPLKRHSSVASLQDPTWRSDASLCLCTVRLRCAPCWCSSPPASQRCLCWLFNLRRFSVGKNSDGEDLGCSMYRARAVPPRAVCLSLLQLSCGYQLLRLKANIVLGVRPGLRHQIRQIAVFTTGTQEGRGTLLC